MTLHGRLKISYMMSFDVMMTSYKTHWDVSQCHMWAMYNKIFVPPPSPLSAPNPLTPLAPCECSAGVGGWQTSASCSWCGNMGSAWRRCRSIPGQAPRWGISSFLSAWAAAFACSPGMPMSRARFAWSRAPNPAAPRPLALSRCRRGRASQTSRSCPCSHLSWGTYLSRS